ncbi:MAG: 30S ribosomal protein S12 methylthiotransferase RimO [Eubacterium sp.]|nr:30S ribosomal protein S12 methylthiotransferase RimO [Eubacterium sp.]
MNVFFVSLGCDKNLVDSEVMLGLLRDNGYTITDNEDEADIIVVNTCSFILDAQDESVESILQMAEKKKGRCKALIVTGCLAQRYEKDIKAEIPEVDAVLGTNSYDKIVEAVNEALKGSFYDCCAPLKDLPNTDTRRVVSTPSHYAYLKISEGCNKVCSYCIIPSLRGRYRSFPMEKLVSEAEYLASLGVKELILVAQETTVYGVDIYGKKSLCVLLRKLSEVEGIEWIRILYCYPEEITDELIEEMRTNKKVCHYLDLPIQHANDEVLKMMGRRTTNKELRSLIKKLKENIPDIALRTTLIAGFPGETEEAHEDVMYFINEMEFDRLGCFAYSREEGTKAANMPCQIDDETKNRWRDEIMELQSEICADINESLIGNEYTVIIDGYIAEEGTYVARSFRDAPDVDGYVFIETDRKSLMSGDMVKVKITGAHEYDLIGVITDEPA